MSDPTAALIPGVEVTAKNTATGVASTTITNESGTYRFPSLQPGSYEVTAALSRFSDSNVPSESGYFSKYPSELYMQVGNVAQTVEVTAAADALLTASTASVGTVLPANQVVDLPLVGRNVIDLVTDTMPGVIGNGTASTAFARSHGECFGQCRHLDGWRDDEYPAVYARPDDILLRQSRPGR